MSAHLINSMICLLISSSCLFSPLSPTGLRRVRGLFNATAWKDTGPPVQRWPTVTLVDECQAIPVKGRLGGGDAQMSGWDWSPGNSSLLWMHLSSEDPQYQQTSLSQSCDQHLGMRCHHSISVPDDELGVFLLCQLSNRLPSFRWHKIDAKEQHMRFAINLLSLWSIYHMRSRISALPPPENYFYHEITHRHTHTCTYPVCGHAAPAAHAPPPSFSQLKIRPDGKESRWREQKSIIYSI